MKKLFLNFVIIITSAIVLVILMFFTSGVKGVYELLATAKYWWIAAAFGCMLIYWFLDVVLIIAISSSLDEKQPLKNTIRVTMIGMFFNCITPFGSGGQPVQIFALAKNGVKTGHAALIVIVKSLLHQIIIVFYTMVAFITIGELFRLRIPYFYPIYLAGLALNILMLAFYALFILSRKTADKVLIFFLKILKFLRLLKNPESIQKKVEAEVASLSEGAAVLKDKYGLMVKLVLIQLVQYTIFFAVPFFIFLAIENRITNIWNMIAAQSIVTMVQLLIPSPGSIGGAEGASYLFFSLFFRANLIIPVILIWRIITYYFSIIVGGIFSLLAPEKPLQSDAGR